MVSNVSNDLKKKVINDKKISYKEAKLFIEYMISKTKLIVDRMYNKNYNYMYLFGEIAFSYGLIIKPVSIEGKSVILSIGGYYFLVDILLLLANIHLTSRHPK